MSMTFRFRMLSDENDAFIREYEVPYDMTLLDFHGFICTDLKYDPENMASFFTSNAEWERLDEVTLFDMGGGEEEGGPLAMENVRLGQVIHQNRDRLIWLFDMINDRAFYLELIGAKKSENPMLHPTLVAASEGDAPDQLTPGKSGGGDGSIFDDAMSEFNDFEGDDNYDDDY